jgi:SAM-dependent methyltransferase
MKLLDAAGLGQHGDVSTDPADRTSTERIGDLAARRDRAESFGSVAADYDRYRPSYPDALMDDLAALQPARVLDVGCGTGKAAVQLAARGLDVLGLEVDARMAAVAAEHGIPVEVSTFEDWADQGRRFDLITCAQAWHWVDPQRGPAKAVDLLQPGGSLAIFWNHADERDEMLLQLAYQRAAPELLEPVGVEHAERQGTFAELLRAGGLFADVTTRDYRWERRYTADDWIGFVATHSDHLALPPERRAALAAELRDVIHGLGGELLLHGGTYVILARLR